MSVIPVSVFAAIITIGSLALAADLTTMAVLTGRCTKVVAMAVVADEALCDRRVTNIILPNGRSGFLFTARRIGQEPVLIYFFGDGRNQIHPNSDTAVHAIDRVHFTFQGATDRLVAVGSCSFANPYKGTPVKISCTADTSKGRFAGDFISNGVAPNVTELR